MTDISIKIYNILLPQVLAEEKHFLIIYKPPRMHSAPLAKSAGGEVPQNTIVDWCAMRFPEIMDLPGRKAGEGGLLHRLDFETQGLMLIARTMAGMETLLQQQSEGKIVKEYSALAAESKSVMPGFPPEKPMPPVIVSSFRPYGPGRKAVRPVSGEKYTTEVIERYDLADVNGFVSFRLRITGGFRHQIRCHLAWLGRPILNDRLYGGAPYGKSLLGLRACLLSFNDRFGDSASEKKLSFSIPRLKLREI